MVDDRDDRSRLASALGSAYELSSRITAIGLEMALPPLFGYWLDQRWGTRLLFLTLGVLVGVLGFVTGLMSLLKRMRQPGPDDRSK